MTQTAPKFLTTRDLANRTGLSVDYFQKKVRSGIIPAMRLGNGPKAPYMIEETIFNKWWNEELRKVEPCQERSENGVRSGMGGLGTKAKSMKKSSIQNLKQWRETASQDG